LFKNKSLLIIGCILVLITVKIGEDVYEIIILRLLMVLKLNCIQWKWNIKKSLF